MINLKGKEWQNFGDANPLQHGGTWIIKDSENCYIVVKTTPNDERENSWLYEECYVDITDSWIDWDAVKSSCDTPNDASDEMKALDIVSYYGCVNCGGTQEWIEGLKAIRKAINSNGIVIHRK